MAKYYSAEGKEVIYAVVKTGQSSGHIPKKLSVLSSVFLRSGSIECQVTGSKKFSCNFPQGGLEIPCKYRFRRRSIKIKKVRDVMKEVYDECEKGKVANEVDGVVEVTGGTEAKKRKMDSDEGWVCIDRITLILCDKDIVVRGEELSDLRN